MARGAVAPAGSIGPIPLPPVIVFWLCLTGPPSIIWYLNTYAAGDDNLRDGDERPRRSALFHPDHHVWVGAYAVCSVCACISGFLLLGVSQYHPYLDVGSSYLFLTIAVVVVGGASMMGGRGGYGHTVLATLIMIQVQTILVGEGVSEQVEEALLGALVICAVALYGRETRHSIPHLAPGTVRLDCMGTCKYGRSLEMAQENYGVPNKGCPSDLDDPYLALGVRGLSMRLPH